MNLQIDGFSANRNLLGKENGGLSFFCKNRRGKRAVFKFFFFVFFALFSSLSFGNDYTIITWSSFVSVYNNADSEDALSLNADITAAADISAGSPASPITIKSYRLNNPVTLSGGNRYRGFVLGDKEINFADIRFNDFKLIGNGAAIYLQNQSTATFSGRHISFANNISTSGAGLTASSSTIEFFRSGNVRNTLEVYFLSNSAAGNNSSVGGAVALFAASQMSFSNASTVNFSSNSAIGNGGALYIGGASQLNVSDSRVVFYGNVSTGNYGGAIYSNASQLSFNNSNISFISNTAFYNGGAVIANEGFVRFAASTVSFTSNSSAGNGGAIYANTDFSLVSFTTSEVKFTSNVSALAGGALNLDLARSEYINSNIVFEGNTAQGPGGAVYVYTGMTFFEKTALSFKNNLSLSSGGALYAEQEMRRNGNNIFFEFVGNQAFAGGAVFYRGFNMELSNALFENNTALSSGGAVYIRGMNASKETEFAVSAVERDSIFTGNKMAGGAIDNDIFIEDGAGSVKLILNAANGRKIELNGGIIGYGTAGAIVKAGAGDLFLAPTFYNGAFTVNEGSVFTTSNAYSGISSFSFRTFRIENGGKFSTADGIEDNISVVDSFSLNGLWEAEIDFEKQFADKIIVSPVIGAYAYFDALSKLQIKVASSDGKYAAIGSSAAIMISPLILSAHSGKIFSNKNAFDRRALYDIFMTTAAGDYQLWVRVSDIVDFESIAKNGNEGKVGGRVNSILDNGISNKITDALMFLASEKNNALVRDAIDQIDGHFYPNLLKSSLINTDADVLYERIMPGSGEHTNAWLEFFGGANLLTSKDYPEQNFKREIFGIRAGGEIISDKSQTLGVYLKYSANSFTQYRDEANSSEMEIGAFGSLFALNVLGLNTNLRGFLGLGFQSYEVERSLGFQLSDIEKSISLNPKSEFDVFSIKGGVKAEYDEIKLPNRISLKPFISLQGGALFHGDINEENGDAASLKVLSDSYFRLESLAGVSFSSRVKKFTWTGKIYGDFLFAENNTAQIYSQALDETLSIDGYAEGSASIWASMSGQYRISGRASLYANIRGGFGAESSAYFAGLSLNYKFGNGEILEEPDYEYEGDKDISAGESEEALKTLEKYEIDKTKQDIAPSNTEKTIFDIEIRDGTQGGKIYYEPAVAPVAKAEVKAAPPKSEQKAESAPLTRSQERQKRIAEIQKRIDEQLRQKNASLSAKEQIEQKAQTAQIAPSTVAISAPAPAAPVIGQQEAQSIKQQEYLEPADENQNAVQETKIADNRLLLAVFDANSAVLSDIARRSIKEAANQLKALAFNTIIVEGYADSITDKVNRDTLSANRARAVYEALLSAGMPADKIKYMGLGSSKPVRNETTVLSRQANRRVEIVIE